MGTFGTSAIWVRVYILSFKPQLTRILCISQHGIASGYYLTFFTGGLITTAARLVRSNVRPLLLPAPGQRPSLAKRIYDTLGTVVSVLILNYAAAPFMLLTARNSFIVWVRVAFYGHVFVVGALVFFYSGGIKFFKGLQGRQGAREETKIKRDSSPTTPTSNKTFMLPPTFDEVIHPQK